MPLSINIINTLNSRNDLYRDLLLRCAEQDKQAFQQLYEICSPKLYTVALRLLNQKEMTEDILQEVFLKIWNSANLFNPNKGTAITWMITVTRNKALDKLRALKSRPQEIESEYESIDFSAVTRGPDAEVTLGEDMSLLMGCIQGMKEEQRECLLLAYYYGYTHVELAEKMNKPLGTVKAWVRRGQEKIQGALR